MPRRTLLDFPHALLAVVAAAHLPSCAAVAVDGKPPAGADTALADGNGGEPPAETCAAALGLYADLGCETLSEGILAFTPAYTLWSDGIAKTRFVFLPPGTQIDTSDPDAWLYPVGTRFWKHFETAEGMRLETRVIEKVADLRGEAGWAFETYAWNEAGDDVERVTRGRRDVLGTDHDIPAEDDCSECHSGGENQRDASLPQDELLELALGFGAIALNHNGSNTTLETLWAAGRLSDEISTVDAVVPGNDTAREALGYLHVNCGSCHGGGAPSKDMNLVVPVGLTAVEDTPTYQQTIDQPTDPDSRADGIEEMPTTRITPGEPDQSAIVWRMQQRGDDDAQMPPLATNVVHEAGVAAVVAWIESL